MARIRTRKQKNTGAREQDRRNELLDQLQEFSKFREEILPVLRDALQKGMKADEIYGKFQAYAAARAVSIAATELDSSKALSAIKDILDRSQGKAKERSEVTHKLEQVPDDQLDALILSRLRDEKDEAEEDLHPEFN